ncbi:MAG: hypothetical protein AAFR81_28945 [Chloroflexota bacterium]
MTQDNSQPTDERGGFILYLSQQSLPIRLLAFIVFILLVVGLIVGITTGLYYFNVSNYPRVIPFAISDEVSVAEYALFDDEEAYPAALATSSDGTLYTGSYAHGAVWQITPDGEPVELPATRDAIGSVIGLDIASNGTLYILDHVEALVTAGAVVWQYSPDGTLTQLADPPLNENDPVSMAAPNDIAVTDEGIVFVLDIALGHILRIDTIGAENDITRWWRTPDETYEIAGLAYDSTSDSLLITDAGRNAIYSIPVSASDPATALETVYTDERTQSPPLFNGIDVASDGTIYTSAFGLNEVWRIDPTSNSFTVLTSSYRGGSDVSYDAFADVVYVNNWDQSWLLPVNFAGIFNFDIAPRLPFSVDLIELNPVPDEQE